MLATVAVVMMVFLAGCGGLVGGDGGSDDATPADGGNGDGMDGGNGDGMDGGNGDGMDGGNGDGMDGGGASGSYTAAPADLIPSGTTGVMHFDSGIFEDQTTADLVNGLIDLQMEQQGAAYSGPESYEEAFSNVNNQEGISRSGINSMTIFFNSEITAQNTQYGAGILQTDWSTEDIIAASQAEFDNLEETTYNGVTVYTSEDEIGQASWYAPLDGGTVVVGSEQAVKDVIDTSQGDASAFSGTLRNAFDNADEGYMTAAIMVPDQQLDQSGQSAQIAPGASDIEIVTMTYYTNGGTMNLDTDLMMTSSSSAQETRQSIQTLLTLAEGQAQEQNPEIVPLLQSFDVSRSGSTVTVGFSATPDELSSTIEAIQQSAMNAGGSSMNSISSSAAQS